MSRDSARRLPKTYRVVARVMIAATVLYALMGVFIVFEAYAQQTYSWVLPTVNKPHPRVVPTGADDKAVNAFYDYDQLRHVASLSETYFMDPYYLTTMYLVFGVVIVCFYGLTYAWLARHQSRGDLYPVETYNAYLTERNGPIDAFNWILWAILLSYMVVYTVVNLIGGQYY
jgi:hypothetical protein